MVSWIAGTFGSGGLAAGGKLSGKLLSKAGEKAAQAAVRAGGKGWAKASAQIAGQAVAFGAQQGLLNYVDAEGNPIPGSERIAHGMFEAAMYPLYAGMGLLRGNLAAKAKGKALPTQVVAGTLGVAAEGLGLSALDGEWWADVGAAIHAGDEEAAARAADKLLTNTLAIGAIHAPGGVRGLMESKRQAAPKGSPVEFLSPDAAKPRTRDGELEGVKGRGLLETSETVDSGAYSNLLTGEKAPIQPGQKMPWKSPPRSLPTTRNG